MEGLVLPGTRSVRTLDKTTIEPVDWTLCRLLNWPENYLEAPAESKAACVWFLELCWRPVD